MAGHHDTASRGIDSAAEGAPGAVDGGLGTAYVLDIVAAVADTAGAISALNAGLAANVRAAASELGDTEAEVGAEFRRMNGYVS